MKECTFKPAIDKNSKKIISSKKTIDKDSLEILNYKHAKYIERTR